MSNEKDELKEDLNMSAEVDKSQEESSRKPSGESLEKVTENTPRKSFRFSGGKLLGQLLLIAFTIIAVGIFPALRWMNPSQQVDDIYLISLGCLFASFGLLQLSLLLGPLSRLELRLLPLLVLRRSMGVLTYLLLTVHFALEGYRLYELVGNPSLVELVLAHPMDFLMWGPHGFEPQFFPHEYFGILAWLLLTAMAVTSHEFWPSALGVLNWKRLHLLVYPAHFCLTAYLAIGVVHDGYVVWLSFLILMGLFVIGVFQWQAANKEHDSDHDWKRPEGDGFIQTCRLDELEEGACRSVLAGRERVALARMHSRVYAFSNFCPQDGGPLGDGQLQNAWVKCPWDGLRYRITDGQPEDEGGTPIALYPVSIRHGLIHVKPEPLPEGARSEGCPTYDQDTPKGKQLFLFLGGEAADVVPRSLRKPYGLVGCSLVFFALIPLMNFACLAGFWKAPSIAEPRREVQTVSGWYTARPVPSLRVSYPSMSREGGRPAGYQLLLQNMGPDSPVISEGNYIEAQGVLSYRSGVVLLRAETVRKAQFPEGQDAPWKYWREVEFLGKEKVEGQLVSLSLFLEIGEEAGLMRNRLAGLIRLQRGDWPALMFRDRRGQVSVMVLGGRRGGRADIFPHYLGRRFTAEGELELHGDFPLLRGARLSSLEK